MMRAACVLATALAALAGCKDEAPPAVQRVQEAAAEADQSLSSVEPTAADPYAAQTCHRADADGLEVLICVYPDEDAAEKGLATIREALAASALTTVARRRGTEVVAIADRDRVDVKGKRIQALLAALADGSAEASASSP